MHGRPRQKAGPPDAARVQAAQKKAALFGQLSAEVLERRAAKRYDPESLSLAGKMLELHPEVYTAWNYRREALQPVLDAGGEAAVAAVAAELALTERALYKNPKSYATWHHRRWIVAKGFCSLERELELVAKLLDADERNFHGWGYRRFVVQLMGTPAERELQYAEHKINQNFSNYSAWHARTTLLPVLHGGLPEDGAAASAATAAEALSAAMAAAARLDEGGAEQGSSGRLAGPAGDSVTGTAQEHDRQQPPAAQEQEQEREAADSGTGDSPLAAARRAPRRLPAGASSATAAVPKDTLDEEYELVKQAFFTEPEDQSGWFYHRWLLGCSLAHWEQAVGTAEEAGERAALLAVLAREQQMCQELLEVEPDAKWPLLTFTRLQEVERQVQQGSSGGNSGGDGGGAASLAADVAGGYARLIELDPLRRGYYEDARDSRAHVVAKPAAVVLADLGA